MAPASIEYLLGLVQRPDLSELMNQLKREKRNTVKDFEWHWRGRLITTAFNYLMRLSSENKKLSSTLRRLEGSAAVAYAGLVRYPRIWSTFLSCLQEIIQFVQMELGKFFAVPKFGSAKTNELVAILLDFLLEIVPDATSKFISHLEGPNSYQIEILCKELKFLLTVLGDAPFLCTELEETKNVLTEIETLANGAGRLLYFCSFAKEATPGTVKQMVLEFFPKAQVMKAKIKDHCITISKLQNRIDPRTAIDSLFIVDSLLEDLNDMVDHNDGQMLEFKDQIKILHDKLIPLRSTFEKQLDMENEAIKQLRLRFRDLAYEAQYLINSFVLGDSHPLWYLDLRVSHLIDKIGLIQAEATSIKTNANEQSQKAADPLTEVPGQPENAAMLDPVMVGFEDEIEKIKAQLAGGSRKLQVISVFGMAGLGKTTSAKKLYNDGLIFNYFDRRAWCVVSKEYHRRILIIDILGQISDLDKDEMENMEDDILVEKLYKTLKGRRYLLVLDDIWDVQAWYDLKICFPDDGEGSRILFTTRFREVSEEASADDSHQLPFLSVDQCFHLLEKRVFGEGRFPRELVPIGKQIAELCGGLPLAVVAIAAVLANDKAEGFWKEAARNISQHISDDPNKCMKILELSYKHLPIHLKPCFLYFASSQKAKEIPVQKLTSLWIAEGFILKEDSKSLEDVAEGYLMDLIKRSVVIAANRRSNGQIKSCNIHDIFRDLCLQRSREENFLKLINSKFSSYEQHRCLCLHSESVPNWYRPLGLHVSSLLGHFPSSFYHKMKLLRVLDLLTNELIDSDLDGIEHLVHLRYLGISCLPSSIGRLRNLEFLLVKNPSKLMLPESILDLVKLRFLHFTGGASPFPLNQAIDGSFRNLKSTSFLIISDDNGEKFLGYLHNLRRLKCEFAKSGGCIALDFLAQLESLNLARRQMTNANISRRSFPSLLKKLSLHAFKLSCEEMSVIGQLKNLEILKLQKIELEEGEWTLDDDEFQELKFLKLDRVNIKTWEAEFRKIQQLVLRNCPDLVEIPSSFSDLSTLEMIEVHECKQSVADSAKRIQEEQEDMGNQDIKVIVSQTSRYGK